MATYPKLATKADFDKVQNGDVDTFLDAATAAVRKECGWHISPIITEEVKLDGAGGVEIDLPTLRLRSLLRVTNGGVPVDVNSIDVSSDGTIALTSGSWTNRLGGIRVTMEHGYDLEDIPDLQNLIVTIAGRAKESPNGVVQEATGSVNIRFSSFGGQAAGGVALFAHERELLSRYKLVGMGR